MFASSVSGEIAAPVHGRFLAGVCVRIADTMSIDGSEILEPLRAVWVLRNGKRRFDRTDKERLIEACLDPEVSIAGLAQGRTALKPAGRACSYSKSYAVGSNAPMPNVQANLLSPRNGQSG